MYFLTHLFSFFNYLLIATLNTDLLFTKSLLGGKATYRQLVLPNCFHTIFQVELGQVDPTGFTQAE
jgi:hypothetical protein